MKNQPSKVPVMGCSSDDRRGTLTLICCDWPDYGIEDGARLVVEEATIKTGIMGGIHLQIETATYGPAPHPLGGPVSTEAHRLSPVWMAVQTNMPSLGVKRSGAYTVWYRGAQVDAEETRFCDLEDIGSYTRIELKPAAPGSVPMSR